MSQDLNESDLPTDVNEVQEPQQPTNSNSSKRKVTAQKRNRQNYEIFKPFDRKDQDKEFLDWWLDFNGAKWEKPKRGTGKWARDKTYPIDNGTCYIYKKRKAEEQQILVHFLNNKIEILKPKALNIENSLQFQPDTNAGTSQAASGSNFSQPSTKDQKLTPEMKEYATHLYDEMRETTPDLKTKDVLTKFIEKYATGSFNKRSFQNFIDNLKKNEKRSHYANNTGPIFACGTQIKLLEASDLSDMICCANVHDNIYGNFLVVTKKEAQKLQMEDPVLMVKDAYKHNIPSSTYILICGTCDDELHFKLTYFGLASTQHYFRQFLEIISQNGAYKPKFMIATPGTKIYNEAVNIFPDASFVTRWYNACEDFFRPVSYVYSINDLEANLIASIEYITPANQCTKVAETLAYKFGLLKKEDKLFNFVEEAFKTDWTQVKDDNSWRDGSFQNYEELLSTNFVESAKKMERVGLTINDAQIGPDTIRLINELSNKLERLEIRADRFNDFEMAMEERGMEITSKLKLKFLQANEVDSFACIERILSRYEIERLDIKSGGAKFIDELCKKTTQECTFLYCPETKHLDITHILSGTKPLPLETCYQNLLPIFPNLQKLEIHVEHSYYEESEPLSYGDILHFMGTQAAKIAIINNITPVNLNTTVNFLISTEFNCFHIEMLGAILGLVGNCPGFDSGKKGHRRLTNTFVFEFEWEDHNFHCNFNIRLKCKQTLVPDFLCTGDKEKPTETAEVKSTLTSNNPPTTNDMEPGPSWRH